MRYVFTLAVLGSSLAYGQACPNLPAGAAALGYSTQVFYDEPQLSEVSETDTDSTSKWYPGSFGQPVASNLEGRDHMSTANGELALSLGAGVSSETQLSKQGALPFLSGSKGFYVEFAMHMSSNDNDHFAGLYLQTVQHNLAKSDHLSSDPASFERWTELDVAETGYGPGALATVINWDGTYPKYTSHTFNSYGHDEQLDFTVEHRYGLSYNPANNTLQWYIDDVPQWKTTEADATVLKDFQYYVVMETASHGANKPYQMFIRYVKAYSK